MSKSFGTGFFRRASTPTAGERIDDEAFVGQDSASPTAANESDLHDASRVHADPPAATLHENLDQQQQERDRRRECWSLLAALQMLRAHLWIGRIGEPTQGLSVILAADAEHQSSFLIDALRDSGEFTPGTALYFDTQVEGRRLRFECELAEIVSMDGGPAYRAVNPHVVLDQQRRNAYRVRVPASLRVPAALSASSFRSPGQVTDLSTRGCCARVESAVGLDRGDPLRVQFKLGTFDVSCAATVRHVESSGGTARIGMEFDIVSTGTSAASPVAARGATGALGRTRPLGVNTAPTPSASGSPSANVPALEQAVARLQREILRRRQELQQPQ